MADRIDWGAVWRRGQQGWPARFPVAQFPNAPLLAYLAASIAERATSGHVQDVTWAIGRVALTAWAYEEVADGTNWFRRGLGAAVLVATVAGLAKHA